MLTMLSSQATHADKHDDEVKKLFAFTPFMLFMLIMLSSQGTPANQTDHYEFIIAF